VIHAASREALATLRSEVESVISGFGSGDEFSLLADELFGVAGLLESQPRLRRMLADPASPSASRATLIETLVSGKIGTGALALVKAAAAQRWSSPWDLVDALEIAANEALLASAQKAGVIEAVEDELFRLERILDVQGNLTTLLDEATVDVARRQGLLETVTAGKVQPITSALLRHAVGSGRRHSILLAIDDLVEAAAARRERSIARVISAVELSDSQQSALAQRLTSLYGRSIDVRLSVDPAIRGGLVVRVGDEIIDGSISSRQAEVRGAFAS
jgi:F-type H+-transporting ATPase subunit delta